MLLNWIRRKLRNRRREIYTFWDGSKFRRADPMVLHRRMLTHPRLDLATHPKEIEFSFEAQDIVVEAARDIFEIEEYNPETQTGLTQEETLDLLWSFAGYCHAKKKSISRAQTSPADSDSKPPESHPEPEDTNLSSEFGSILAGSNFDMPRR